MVRTLDDYRRIVEQGLTEINYPSGVESLYEPIRYTLSTGGKRIRPVLMLATYDWLRGGRDGVMDPGIVKVALAVELFHNFSLLHDDLMDRSALRRGQPTVWRKWSPDVALLSGDAMSIMAFGMLSDTGCKRVDEVLREFAAMAQSICQGQQLDMEFEAKADSVTQDEYLSMIDLKTAALFVRSQSMAAHLAQADAQVRSQLAVVGGMFGRAFQIQDDLLDTYGTTARLGKECGDDIVDNKVTFLQIYARDHANTQQREELRASQREESSRAEKVHRVKAVYDAVGVREATEKQIQRLYEQAVQHLEQAEQANGRRHELMRAVLTKLQDRDS